MLKLVIFLFFLVAKCYTAVTCKPHTYSVDFTDPVTSNILSCLRDSRYTELHPRVSKPDGEVDMNGINTLKWAKNGTFFFYTDSYITPDVSTANGNVQIDKLLKVIRDNNLGTGFTIQVTRDSASWSNDYAANGALINSMITRLVESGEGAGILTSLADWASITGNSKTLSYYRELWYSNVYGPGVTGESPQSYDDFVGFGPWPNKYQVLKKQFAKTENVCGLNVNRNVHVQCTSN